MQDRILFGLAVLVLVFAVFGLFREKAAAKNAVITLVFNHNWEGREEILKTLKDEYELQNRNIRININYVLYNELSGSPGSATASCDIIAVDATAMYQLKQKEPDTETYILLKFLYPLYYNTEILAEAGFNRPPKTRTEFLAQARKVTNAESGVHAIAIDTENQLADSDILPWVIAGGTSAADNNIFNRELAAAQDFFNKLKNEGMLLESLPGADKRKQAFIEGKTAFFIGSAKDMELLKLNMGEKLNYSAIPAPDAYAGKPFFCSGSWVLSVTEQSKHKNEARSFIDFLLENSFALAGGWAIPENGNPADVQDPFYYKAREFYISGELVPVSAAR